MRRPATGLGRIVRLVILGALLATGPAAGQAAQLANPFLASDSTSFYLPVRADWFGIVSALPERPAAADRPALAREALCAASDVLVVAKMIELGEVEVRFFQVTGAEFAKGPRALRRAEPYARIRLDPFACSAAATR